MGKVKVYSISRSEKRRIFDELFEVISNLKNKTEAVDFLFGLLTPSEVLMTARRIQIAKMLLGDYGYDDIQRKLKVSHTTINKVEHWLKENEDRNKFIAAKIEKAIINKSKTHKPKNLLDKYAHHRFIKELLQ
ncbi:MAG: YerC/YecD family TrpR-related protein [Parcubacteria group bacterium]|jgi:TrpR-related protein YerC/YecD